MAIRRRKYAQDAVQDRLDTESASVASTATRAALNAFLRIIDPTKLLTLPEAKTLITDTAKAIDNVAEKTEVNVFAKLLLQLATNLATLPFTIGGVASINAEKGFLQPTRKLVRPGLLGPAEALEASRRELPTEDVPKDIPDYYLEQMRRAGIPDEQIEILRKLQWYIPTATDIISFAVREVYSPEKWGLPPPTEDFDLVYKMAADDIKKAGLDEKTFGKFWLAHWILPSVLQGFEMLHRREIKEEDLDRLMIMLDIMPEWRRPLKAISFSPLTRVDVRRMHKIGALKDADLVDRYRDVGYSVKNAELMRDFTIAYNGDPEGAEQTATDVSRAAEKDLTKTDVLSGYRDGLITLQNTKDILYAIGYDPEEIEFYISREDFKRERDLLKKSVEYLHRAFAKGIYTEAEVIDRLGTLRLPAKYTKGKLDAWKLEIEIPTAIPSKAEFLRWFKKAMIDEAALRQGLSKIGYSEKYIALYVQETQK